MLHELHMVGPERSKFCALSLRAVVRWLRGSARRQCVPVFDHYCAFLRSSVGQGNYGAFFGCVLLSLTTCSCLVAAAYRLDYPGA